MTRYFILLFTAVLAALITFAGLPGQDMDNRKDFDAKWTEVEKLLRENKTQTALGLVNEIYFSANKLGLSDYKVKAFSKREELRLKLEETDLKTVYRDYIKTINEAKTPEKQLFQIFLATELQSQLNMSRYQIINRIADIELPEDPKEWAETHYVQTITNLYRNALELESGIENFRSVDFPALLHKTESTPECNFFLYELIAQKAEDYFKSSSYSQKESLNPFSLNNEIFLGSAAQYGLLDLPSDDPYSALYNLSRTYKNLLRFQVQFSSSDLPKSDIKRLEFVFNNLKSDKKDKLYKQRLITSYSASEDEVGRELYRFELARQLIREGKRYNRPDESHRWKLKEAVELLETLSVQDANVYVAKMSRYELEQIERKEVNFKLSSIIPQKTKSLFLIEYRNANQIEFEIKKWTEADQNRINKMPYNERQAYILSRTSIREFSLNTNNPDDYQKHSTEWKIEGLDYGRFVLVALIKDKDKLAQHVDHSFITVSNMAVLEHQNENELAYVLTDRITGEPLSGIDVKIFKKEWSRTERKTVEIFIEEGKTTKDGFYCFSAESQRSQYFAVFTSGEDELSSTARNLWKNHDQKEYIEHNFFLDRAIYRPGQKLQFKIISSLIKPDADNEIVKGLKLKISLFDANGQLVSEQNLTGNNFGSVDGSVMLPEGLLTGYFSLRCGNYSKSFRVEEYKRPSFKLELNEPEEENMLGETVSLKGKAETYAGAGLSGALIKYRIIRKPIWRPYYGMYWRSPNSTERNEAEIAQGIIKTEKDGSFEISFLARSSQALRSSDISANLFDIQIDAIDQNGEQIHHGKQFTIGNRTLNISSNLPKLIGPNNFKDHKLNIENFQGKGQKAELTIELYKLAKPEYITYNKGWEDPDLPIWSKEEFKKEFPNISIDQEDEISKYQISNKIKSGTFSADSKFSLSEFYNLNLVEGYYKLVVKAKDKNNQDIELILYPTVINSSEKDFKILSSLEVLSNKNKIEVGEELEIVFASSLSNQNIFIQIAAPEKILYKKWIKLNGNKSNIKILITEEFRGGIKIQAFGMSKNNVFNKDLNISVPFSNKELKLKWETFRDKLLPNEQSTWKLKITDHKDNPVQAELLAGMYDASLDYFEKLQWAFGSGRQFHNYVSSWTFGSQFNNINSSNLATQVLISRPPALPPCYELQFHSYGYMNFRDGRSARGGRVLMDMASEEAAPAAMATKSGEEKMDGDGIPDSLDKSNDEKREKADATFPLRKNFNETAFFLPTLNTNAQGGVEFTFKVPESLTEWNFSAFAHSMELQTGTLNATIKTQQDFMIQALTPRFLRESDTIILTARLSNLTEEDLNLEANLEVSNLSETENISDQFLMETGGKRVQVNAKSTSTVSWKLAIPKGSEDLVVLKVSAQNETFKDGEQHPLPVLKNSMMVVESINLPIVANSSRSFKLDKLSGLLGKGQVHSLSLEVTSNPVWLAIQSLPYILEYPYDCNEQIFSRVFANSIAAHIANSDERIKGVFEEWNKRPEEDLISPLEKNSDLKNILLQESPWVREAQSETERMRRVALLFDIKKMETDGKKAIAKLQKQQNWDGGFSWFKTGRSNRFISQHISSGFGQLDRMNIKSTPAADQIKTKLVRYLDQAYSEDLKRLKRYKNFDPENNHFSEGVAHYLYTRSFYKNIGINDKEVMDFWMDQAEKFGQQTSIYSRAMLAIAFNRDGNKIYSEELLEGIKQNAITKLDLGSFFNGLNGYRWYQSDIETQATVIEAFEESTDDLTFVENLKTWLLKHKQSNQWKSTKATALACYALLLQGQYWLAESKDLEVSTSSGEIISSENKQAGTGYFRNDYTSSDLNAGFSQINMKNENKVAAWASAYWKYFAELDKIDHYNGNLKIRKEYAVVTKNDRGLVSNTLKAGQKLNVGDKILVRIIIDVDREMDFVHLKDQRASGMEPVKKLSGYQYRSGLAYYQSVRDASTNFFFDHLPRGKHVFEYELKAVQQGSFSTGISSLSSMYAPEFSSHSSGIRLNIEAQK